MMKDSRSTVIVSGFVLLVFMLFCVRPARAALPPSPYTPATTYTVFPDRIAPPSSFSNSYPVELPPSSGNLVPTTLNNFYSPSGGLPLAVPNSSGGGIEIPAIQQVTIGSPAGSAPVPSIPEVPSVTFTETINMGGGGAGSPAALMSENALGLLGAGAGIFVGSPLVKLAGAITLGSALYNALKGQGILSNPDGSTSIGAGIKSCPADIAALEAAQNAAFTNYVTTCQMQPPDGVDIYCTRYGTYPGAPPASGLYQITGQCSASHITTSLGVPATNQNIIDALNKATQALNVAADAVNWSMSQGVPIPAGRPVVSVPPSVALSGNPTLTNTTTDTTGTTTNTYSQPTSNIAPSSTTGSPPSVTPGTRVTNTVNNSPTTITNTFSPPMIFAPPLSGGGGLPQQPDLCALHPDILACSNDANVGDVASQALAVNTVQIPSSLTPVAVPSGLGICPAPIVLLNSFGRIETWDISSKLCAFLLMIKPIVLAFAWLSAASILFIGKPLNV